MSTTLPRTARQRQADQLKLARNRCRTDDVLLRNRLARWSIGRLTDHELDVTTDRVMAAIRHH